MAPTLVGEQAVVVGAGMGGLAAAAALADHFERVVVPERDTLPPDAAHRAGTPQFRHIHGLLAGQRPPDLDGMLKLRRAFNRLAAADPAVHKLTTEVGHLLKPRSVLRDPGLAERVQAMMTDA
jgi:phytoene dehydrogenase-like protein